MQKITEGRERRRRRRVKLGKLGSPLLLLAEEKGCCALALTECIEFVCRQLYIGLVSCD